MERARAIGCSAGCGFLGVFPSKGAAAFRWQRVRQQRACFACSAFAVLGAGAGSEGWTMTVAKAVEISFCDLWCDGPERGEREAASEARRGEGEARREEGERGREATETTTEVTRYYWIAVSARLWPADRPPSELGDSSGRSTSSHHLKDGCVCEAAAML